MTLYFVAGEMSGDNHGAALMSSLRRLDTALAFVGRGGPQMGAVAGPNFKDWLDEAAVLGLWEVIKKYGYFRRQFRETLAEIEKTKPDAVVLIDYPGFNLRLARALWRQSPAQKIIYYISPQVWAWNRGRIKKMARFLDLMLCIFPFEAELYNKSGLRAQFVGHPMIDRLGPLKSAGRTDSSGGEIDIERKADMIGLFPGSRRREVRKIFPVMIDTADEMQRARPNLRFEVAAASPELADEMRRMITPHLDPLPSARGEADAQRQVRGVAERIGIKVGETNEIMQRAVVGIVASGSATLEAAYSRLPFVLVYKVAWPTYLAARLVVSVRYLGMPNVLANNEVVPEFIQQDAKPAVIAKALLRLMDDAGVRENMMAEFDSIIAKLGEGGASEKAARAILSELGQAE